MVTVLLTQGITILIQEQQTLQVEVVMLQTDVRRIKRQQLIPVVGEQELKLMMEETTVTQLATME